MSLLNRSATRTFILDTARRLRPHLKLDRVSDQTYQWLELVCRNHIRGMLERHPSAGKTVFPPIDLRVKETET